MVEFVECTICAAKPGSPELCPSCRHNRDAIYELKYLLKDLISQIESCDGTAQLNIDAAQKALTPSEADLTDTPLTRHP